MSFPFGRLAWSREAHHDDTDPIASTSARGDVVAMIFELPMVARGRGGIGLVIGLSGYRPGQALLTEAGQAAGSRLPGLGPGDSAEAGAHGGDQFTVGRVAGQFPEE